MLNGILVFRKPMDFTSFDVVAKLRGILKMRKIGHAGTLDPNAEGVLVVLLGTATRASEHASGADKEYIATIRLGLSTDTQDIWGKVESTRPVEVDDAEVEQVIAGFAGQYDQMPPMYSAIWVDGVRLYDLARQGISVERQSRTVELFVEYLGKTAEGDYKIRAVCSKGTYIRTLCHDIGEKLGCGAVMSSLIRTRSGQFTLEQALSFDEVSALCESGEIEKKLYPTDGVFLDLPPVIVNAEGRTRALNGAHLSEMNIERGAVPNEDELCRVYDLEGNFLLIGKSAKLEKGGLGIFSHKTFYTASE